MVTAKPCILLVDHDANDVHDTARSLRRQPFAVYTACSFAEAVAILSEETIPVIAYDAKSAVDENGDLPAWATLHRPQTVRLLLTTEQGRHDAEVAVQRGAAITYVIRPCASEQLAQAICSALEFAGVLPEPDCSLSGGK
jgi:DNA-binding NtrC family response regulator